MDAFRTTGALSHKDYTVACICPIGVELAPVEAMLDEEHPPLPTSRDQNAYTLGRLGTHNVVVAAMPQTGNNSAALVAAQLLNDFPSIRFGLLVGVGGGMPGCDGEDDIRLGDVVVSKPTDTFGGVVQYDMGTATTNGVFRRTGSLAKPPAVLRANVEKLRAQHLKTGTRIPQYLAEMMTKYPRMRKTYASPGAAQDRLFLPTYDHQGGSTCSACDTAQLVARESRAEDGPEVHYGTIGSANVVIKDGAVRELLKEDMRILCLEMEAAGLMETFPSLVIRGICDYADSHKNERWSPYAAAAAAAYMKELLLMIPSQATAMMEHAADIMKQIGEQIFSFLFNRNSKMGIV
jgi:nucleoside phosphorylase